MKIYNKIMSFFWLSFGIAITAYVSYKGMSQGFDRWKIYYVFALVAFAMFLIKRWMMNRMEKHKTYLDSVHATEQELPQKKTDAVEEQEDAKEK